MRRIAFLALVFIATTTASRSDDVRTDGNLEADGQLISNAASGPPLVVNSEEWVDGLNADRVDGYEIMDIALDSHDHPGSGYARVIVVAESGGDFTSIDEALKSITSPGPSDRHLVWVAPGTYTENVTMREYVDVQGAGEGMTTVTSTIDPTVTTAPNSELRSLTVEQVTSGKGSSILINDGSPRLLHVTATTTVSCAATGKDYTATAIEMDFSSPTLNEVIADAEADGTVSDGSSCLAVAIQATGSRPELLDVVLDASNPPGFDALAVSQEDGQFLIRESVLSATGTTVGNTVIGQSGSASTRVAHTQLTGDVDVSVSGDLQCVGAYDAGWIELGPSCQ